MVDKLYEELDSFKQQYTNITESIKRKEQEIADVLCPLKIGDKVTVIKDSKIIEGIVEEIHCCYKNPIDAFSFSIGTKPTWSVQGAKINKTSATPGKHSFDADPIHYDYDNNLKTFTLRQDSLSTFD